MGTLTRKELDLGMTGEDDSPLTLRKKDIRRTKFRIEKEQEEKEKWDALTKNNFTKP